MTVFLDWNSHNLPRMTGISLISALSFGSQFWPSFPFGPPQALPKNRLEPSPLEQMAKRLQRPKDASFYAHVGDVSVAELNQLESKFFELLQWKADVPWQTCQFHSICINSPFWSYEAKASEARNSFGESPNWCDLKTHPSHPQPVMT